jgi:hypothetical protein
VRVAVYACLVFAACAVPPSPSEPSHAAAHPNEAGVARVVFRPSDSQIVTPAGTFGACERKRNSTGVFTVFCDKLGDEAQEGLIFNFYLPGVWTKEPFTAEEVAKMLQAQSRSDSTFVSGFAAPDSRTGVLNYFLFLSATYPETRSGQGYLARVAPLGDGVYSLLHTRTFEGPPELMPEVIRRWLAETVKQNEQPTSVIEASEEWLSVVRGER